MVDGDGGLIDGSLVDRDSCLVFCRDGGGGLTVSDDDNDSGLVSSSEDDGDGRFVPVSCILLQVLPLWHCVEHAFQHVGRSTVYYGNLSYSYMICRNRHCQGWLFLLLHAG